MLIQLNVYPLCIFECPTGIFNILIRNCISNFFFNALSGYGCCPNFSIATFVRSLFFIFADRFNKKFNNVSLFPSLIHVKSGMEYVGFNGRYIYMSPSEYPWWGEGHWTWAKLCCHHQIFALSSEVFNKFHKVSQWIIGPKWAQIGMSSRHFCPELAVDPDCVHVTLAPWKIRPFNMSATWSNQTYSRSIVYHCVQFQGRCIWKIFFT